MDDPWAHCYDDCVMILVHAALAIALAGVSVMILTTGLRLRSRRSVWALFVVLFLTTWAGGIWAAPFGPPIGRIYWVPFTLIAILVAILLAAVLPPEVHTQAEAVEREAEIEAGLGVFFWVLVIALGVGIALRYLR